MKNRIYVFLLTLILSIFSVSNIALAASYDQVISRWTKEQYFSNEYGNNLTITCTYYSAEFIEAYIQSEAQKSLWTQNETEDYKYNFLQALQLNDMIPIHIKFLNNGPSMHLGPFDIMVKLRIGNKLYKAVDYDKRFNFKLSGKMDGIVTFARYDEKTGKDLLEKAKDIRLILSSSISIALSGRGDVKWVWDITRDNPEALGTGKAVDRLELDRLIKRLAKLSKDKADLQDKIDELDKEINEVNTRVSELQSR